MNNAVINFASKDAWYPRGQARLARSLATHHRGFVRLWDDEANILAPRHAESPYAFKPRAFRVAKNLGFGATLWCDASVWAIRDLRPVFAHIEQHGHLFFYNCSTGPWSSDSSLKNFKVTREDAFQIPMLMGLCMGLDLRHERAREFLRRWEDAIPTFAGSWTNERRQVSKDPRVRGHRHDQTASSIIAHQLGMETIIAHESYLFCPSEPAPESGDHPSVPANVCLLAQGM